MMISIFIHIYQEMHHKQLCLLHVKNVNNFSVKEKSINQRSKSILFLYHRYNHILKYFSQTLM